MASYKDLSKTQITRILKLSRYGMITKVIADKVSADANQIYQYFKVNGKPEIVQYNDMIPAEKANFTRMVAKNEIKKKYRIAQKQATTKSLVKKAKNFAKHVIPAGMSYSIKNNQDGTVSIIY
jgi:hypothetical protein